MQPDALGPNRLPLGSLSTALGGDGAEGLLTSVQNETVGGRFGMPPALGAVSEGRAIVKQSTALGLLPSALAGDNSSKAGELPGEASDPRLLLMLQADLLPVTTTLGKLVRGLGQGERERCKKADRWRPAAGVGGVALPGVWAEAARPGVTLACIHKDNYLNVTTAEKQLTDYLLVYLICKVNHNQHQKLGTEKLLLVSRMQGLVSQYNIYTISGIDARPSSKHQGTLVMQCLTEQLEKRVTCGVSPLVRLARAGRGDMFTRGLGLGPSQGVPMAHDASTQAMGDGNSHDKAECMLVIGGDKGEGLLVLAAASASSSAGDNSIFKGEEGSWLVTGAALTVPSRGLSRQGAGA